MPSGYRGKASPGCAACRKRRIKCDRLPQGCRNCAKAGWECPGYRDPLDLLFCHQTDAVVTKARTTVDSTPPQPKRPKPSSLLVPNPEDLAVGFFFSRYVLLYHKFGHLWTLESGNGCLNASIVALGLSDLATERQGAMSPHLETKYYMRAVQKTSDALRSPNSATADSTLLAIHVLSIFELVKGFEKDLASWQTHVRGASSLLKLRGAEQFTTQTGSRLFLYACGNLILSCIFRAEPIPRDIWTLKATAEDFLTEPYPLLWRLHVASMRFADLYATYSHQIKTPATTTLLSTTHSIRTAVEIYTEFHSMLATAEPHWKPIDLASTPLAFPPSPFENSLPAQVWSIINAYQLALLHILLRLTPPEDLPTYFVSDAHITAVQTAMVMVKYIHADVLRVITHYVTSLIAASGDKSSPNHPQTQNPAQQRALGKPPPVYRNYNPFPHARATMPDLPFVALSGGLLIQWPLFVLGISDGKEGEFRAQIVGLLERMAERLHVVQAKTMAGLLRDGFELGTTL